MKRFVCSILVFFLFPVATHATADHFIYPMSAWRPTREHGQVIGDGLYHVGVDAGFGQGEGGPVYAVADGIVREVRTRTQFGLVILIEHTLPNGNEIVSLYGHLRATDPQVSEGQAVTAGGLLGYLGNTEENGGWRPHIHFGIHKEAYTGEWKYPGHVTSVATVDKWFDPETYIPERLTVDTWKPVVDFNFTQGQTVADVFIVDVLATDIGSGVTSVNVEASDDGQQTWQSVASYTGEAQYPNSFYTSLAGLEDGRVYLRVSAEDAFGNVGTKTTYVRLKAYADLINHVATTRGGLSVGRVYTRAQNGELKGEFMTSATEKTTSYTDIDVGDVTGNGSKNIVMVKKENGKTGVVTLSKEGSILGRFAVGAAAFNNDPRIATGDVDGDGVDEIVLGSGPGATQQVRVYKRDGTVLWKRQPFKRPSRRGVDVAAGDMDGDGVDEVIVGMRAGAKSKVIQLSGEGKRGVVVRVFDKKYRGGVNVATGDTDGDGVDEIIVGTGGGITGTVRVIESTGEKSTRELSPFGKKFTGPIDVSSTDWEEDGKDEIMVSQAGDGEAWVKTYRFTAKKRVVFEQRVFEEGFEEGARIAGW